MLRYRDEADTEVDAITDYIISRFGPDVAGRFDNALAEAERLIIEYPNAHPKVGHGCRRILLANHPYQLVYRVEGDVIVIYAVAHLARRPRYWNGRIG